MAKMVERGRGRHKLDCRIKDGKNPAKCDLWAKAGRGINDVRVPPHPTRSVAHTEE
jgi:hypothetical protein